MVARFWETESAYYFNARWYDSDTGRFITEDPIRDGENWYAYCSNNPVMFRDPSGLSGGNIAEAIQSFMNLDFGKDQFDEASFYGKQFLETGDLLAGLASICAAGNGVAEAALDMGIAYSGAAAVGEAVGSIATFFGKNTVVGDASAAGNGTTTLYRAVGPAELADINSTNALRNLGSAEGKYFTTSAAEASSYAKQAVEGFGDPAYTLIKTEVPKTIFDGLLPATVDRGIPAWVIPNERLQGLVPRVLNSMPLPPR